MKYYSVFIILWLLTLVNASLAKDIKLSNQRIEKFVNAQGFYQNTVNAITSDKNGYLWIASPNGLIKYDGYSFEYHYNDPGNPETIPNNYITSLLNDSDGKLWIGTRQGICLYISDKEQFSPIKNIDKHISLIKEDPYKRVWIASGSALFVYKSEINLPGTVSRVREINLSNVLERDLIIDIEFLSESALIVASSTAIYEVTINEGNESFAKTSVLQNDLKGLTITKLLKVENSIWVGTNKGLFQVFHENNNLITLQKFLYSEFSDSHLQCYILTLFLDAQKELWIGTARNGVLKFDSKKNDFIAFHYDPKKENVISSNRINCLYEDDFGVLWIGTAQGGINKLDKNQKPFHNYSNNPYDDQSLTGNLITDICEDRNGRIWVSFFENTICRSLEKVNLDEGSSIRFERLEKQLSQLNQLNAVRIFQDSKGYWWIGTTDGVFFFDEVHDKLRQVQIKSGEKIVHNSNIRIIEQPDPNHILIGGSKLCLLEDPWESILKDKPVQINNRLIDLGNNLAQDFEMDGFGFYWFGTREGIYRIAFENNELVLKNHWTTNPGMGTDSLQLSHNNIFCIHNNLNKDIWVGTFGGGLMDIQLDPSGQPEKIKVFHRKDGLPDDAIYGILEDEKGIFWLSTDMGICQFDPTTEKIDVYDVNDGLSNYNFRQSAYLKTKSGIMLMGGLNGLTVFDPKEISKNVIPPRVIISRLKINNQSVLTGQKVNGKILLEKSISNTQKLEINHISRNLSLDIIVQHNSAPKKNRVSYMLEGVNENWIDMPEGKTTATYTNLSPGTYRFLYKGANGDGIWTEKTSELIIEVLAPWYLRWWSLMIWVSIVIFIAYEIFDYLVRLEKLKQKLKFEQMDKERVHEIDQAKLRFFTNISHEFKTPLSLIIGPLEKIVEQNKRKENQKYFAIIQNNITRLKRLVEQLISYRKAETGYLDIVYSKTTLGNFIYPLLEAFEENAKRTNINFFYKVQNPDREIVIDIDKTERILLNLFSNAVKFTRLDGDVSIEAGFNESGSSELLLISVSDNGIGIPSDKIDKIFDRFYRAVDNQENWDGTGIGLALCKSLIDLMKGAITVESTPNEKTIFKVSLPIEYMPGVNLVNEMSNNRHFVTDLLPAELEEVMELKPKSDRPTILIIDDEPDVRQFLHEAFQGRYNVVLAEDGKEGLKELNKNQIQLVICDVMMPQMDGFKVCEKIKSNPETCYIPIILLTALDDTSKQMEGLEYGADAYITKPFSIKHLELRVKKLIENKQRIIEYFSNSSVISQDLGMPEKDRRFLEKITLSIEKNMGDSDFGVEELAKESGMSTSHFYRRLKQLTGQVPNVYLRNYRLQKAAQFFKSKRDLNSYEVMYEIGIESPSYFSTSFKKLHGITPSEYIKKQKD